MEHPEFHIVKANAKPTYQSIADRFSSGLRDALLDFSLSSGLSEADCIYWILAGQADLYDAQTKALLSALGGVQGNSQAPDLNPDQIEKAVIRALQKRRDDVGVLSALDEMPRLVGNHVDKLLQDRIEAFRKELTPEKEREGRHCPAWIRKGLAFLFNRWFIAIACLLLGALPFLLLYVQSERQRADDATNRIVAMMAKLPDSVRLNMAGSITYSEASNGKPAKVVLNFGQKFRPIDAQVTRSGEVEVLFAPR